MTDDTINRIVSALEPVIRGAVSEHVIKMQESSGSTVSRLFFDFKADHADKYARIDTKLDQVIGHVKETNGRVKDLEKKTQILDDTIEAKVKERKEDIKKNFWLTMKIFAVGFILGSFLWIKESRDLMIATFFHYF